MEDTKISKKDKTVDGEKKKSSKDKSKIEGAEKETKEKSSKSKEVVLPTETPQAPQKE